MPKNTTTPCQPPSVESVPSTFSRTAAQYCQLLVTQTSPARRCQRPLAFAVHHRDSRRAAKLHRRLSCREGRSRCELRTAPRCPPRPRQREGDVLHVIAQRLTNLSALLGDLTVDRDFR